MFLAQIFGGFAGAAIFLTTSAVVASALHDGKGSTMNGHMETVVLLFFGTGVSFCLGSWIIPSLLA